MSSKKAESRKRQKVEQSSSLTEDQQRKIQDAFHVFDVDKTGNILTKEAKYAFKSLGLEAKKDEIQAAAGAEEDRVDFASFVRLAETKLVQREKALAAFRLFDKDNKGVICLEDLQRVSHELGEDFTDDQLEEMLEQADKSGDCLLGQEDFLQLARKVNL